MEVGKSMGGRGHEKKSSSSPVEQKELEKLISFICKVMRSVLVF